jgi:hypothetical protein
MGEWIYSYILDYGISWGWVVSLTPRPLYPREGVSGTHCIVGRPDLLSLYAFMLNELSTGTNLPLAYIRSHLLLAIWQDSVALTCLVAVRELTSTLSLIVKSRCTLYRSLQLTLTRGVALKSKVSGRSGTQFHVHINWQGSVSLRNDSFAAENAKLWGNAPRWAHA